MITSLELAHEQPQNIVFWVALGLTGRA